MWQIDYQMERMLIAGFPNGTSPEAARLYSKNLNNKYVVMTYPDYFIVDVEDNEGDTYETVVDGAFLAATLAGKFSAYNDPSKPFQLETLAGVKRFGNDRTLSTREQTGVAGDGCLLVQPKGGIFVIMDDITTDRSSQLGQQFNIVRNVMRIQQEIRGVLEPMIKGQKNIPSVRKSLERTISSMLDSLVGPPISRLNKYANIRVEVDPTDITGVLISYDLWPVAGLKRISVTQYIRASN
jgi:hypothetical protein